MTSQSALLLSARAPGRAGHTHKRSRPITAKLQIDREVVWVRERSQLTDSPVFHASVAVCENSLMTFSGRHKSVLLKKIVLMFIQMLSEENYKSVNQTLHYYSNEFNNFIICHHKGHLHLLANFATFRCKLPSNYTYMLETSPEKYQAGVRFFWNFAKFQAKLASVNGNRRNVATFHHVTLGTSGLLATRALWNVYRILGPHAYCMRCIHECMHCSLWSHMRTTNQKLAKFQFHASVNGRIKMLRF